MNFNWIAPFYDKLIVYFSFPGRLVELLDIKAGDQVLDVAGGTGLLAKALENRGIRLTIIDVSEGMLAKARQKGLQAELVHGDSAELPWEIGTFDYVVMTDALHHMNRPEQALREAIRVLKNGGKLAIQDFDTARGWGLFAKVGERLLGNRERFWTEGEIADFLKAEKLANVQVIPFPKNQFVVVGEKVG